MNRTLRALLPLEAATFVVAAAVHFGALGLSMIAVGVGPRTVPDVVSHVAILAVLAAGVVSAAREPRI